ncbi:phosphatidylinositol 4-phosphate 5-kinase-like protein 1 isoform X4 [Homo sapiens]|uniref:phosphatidylinositol 4-phosphate 5-kinase-like protein 1 isoform X4 n=1 Tax=Homo sapiens TaxID=9606 RepID=UPI001FB06F4D|nr:phosphatidylinositol 4-phosphate 5-kinase-like protein 1 isoform X4 [Homo sapiens]XP_054217967.1 phosphatidylinositol 4-phosphate 5-kinase-like protein 1 isoform X4 [Homo sapiens]
MHPGLWSLGILIRRPLPFQECTVCGWTGERRRTSSSCRASSTPPAASPRGPQRSWFLRQMELDTTFLRELNVLDYSLLIAFQRLHEDERGPGSSLIFRTARTLTSSSLAPSSCLHLSSGLCKGHRARKSREPKTAGCCPTPPTPYTSWTGPSSAISWASWISPQSTGSASGWSTCGRHCATQAGPSPLSARLATPVASASGWRRTRSDGRPAPLSGSGRWAHARNAGSPGPGHLACASS